MWPDQLICNPSASGRSRRTGCARTGPTRQHIPVSTAAAKVVRTCRNRFLPRGGFHSLSRSLFLEFHKKGHPEGARVAHWLLCNHIFYPETSLSVVACMFFRVINKQLSECFASSCQFYTFAKVYPTLSSSRTVCCMGRLCLRFLASSKIKQCWKN